MVSITIFDIKKFAIHDGPGIRTTVFLKGCPLNCWWCHNPESRKTEPEEVAYSRRLGEKEIEQRKTYGKTLSIEDVLLEILRDKLFFEESQGGVTFSGGEPLIQAAGLAELLKQCKKHGIHTAIDTCGHVQWSCFERVLPYTDLFLYDLKLIDPTAHNTYTSVDNQLILANLERLFSQDAHVELRIPYIPGINDTRVETERILSFLGKEVSRDIRIHLLPYHDNAKGKYRKLKVENQMNSLQADKGVEIEAFRSAIVASGFEVVIGG